VNASERKRIREAISEMQRGDRSAALTSLRRLVCQVTIHATWSQLKLPIVLDQTFRCERLNIDAIRVRECLYRRSRVYPSGNRKGAPQDVALTCVGCEVGAALAAQLPGYVPPPSTQPRETGGRRAHGC
jgi:hypothetical protein